MKRKDTDFLHATTRARALERQLLNKERMERMLDAKSMEEALKLLPEMGYEEVAPPTLTQLGAVLSRARRATYELMRGISPIPELVDVFAIKYDYHNAKAIIKAEARGVSAAHLLVDAGRISPAKLETALRQRDLRDLPAAMRNAVEEARDVLARTEDPRFADMILDRACFAEELALAKSVGDAYLIGFVKLRIDAANLRSVVRATRQKQSAQVLKGVLLSGGDVEVNSLLSPDGLLELYRGTTLEAAAEEGIRAMSGSVDFVLFEKLCDDAITEYLKGAKLIPFGVAPLVAYLAAKETEITTLRIIFAGKSEDLPADEIRERLRAAYV
ncbi:MAG: V-type ATPase subunit [Oscillospiraceae bacterium]|nr:V-type ATPase subunit [Oscillospiraceae bacterium]